MYSSSPQDKERCKVVEYQTNKADTVLLNAEQTCLNYIPSSPLVQELLWLEGQR